MPVSYVYDADARVLTWTVVDPIVGDDWSRAFDAAQRDPGLQGTRPLGMVVDLRGRTEFRDHLAIRSLALEVRDRLSRLAIKGLPLAVLVSSSVAHGMARMTEGYVGDTVEMRIFKDLEAARGWVLAAREPQYP